MQRRDLQKCKLPDEPGVYTFKKGKKILYIGKATSLRDRVRSYFVPDLIDTRGTHIVAMIAEADTLDWEPTNSVLEALILEANMIKRHMPPYNAASKDNKSFNYLVIAKEDFPRVLVVRGRELYQNWKDSDIKHLFGPFPQGLALQDALKIVRKIFPYRDSKCIPCPEQLAKNRKAKHSGASANPTSCRPCFNRQIGLCPGVCTGEMSSEQYAQQVKNICILFSGNFRGLKRELTKQMRAASAKQEFEKAAMLRRQCAALEHIKDVSLIKAEKVSAGGGARIEAFDVAHTSGQETVAVMTVVMSGEAYKAAYRKFKILTATNNDVAALSEALERRLTHPEWPLPRAFAVDGSIAQIRAAEGVLKKAGIGVPIVGVVKDERHKPVRLIGDKRVIEAFEKDILLANREAHRFAINWHRRRRGKIY
jgi:excinuclease ABC subunit C